MSKKNENAAIEWLKETLEVPNDAALSKTLGVSPPVISKIRTGRNKIGYSLLIRIHDLTQLPIKELRGPLNIPEWNIPVQ